MNYIGLGNWISTDYRKKLAIDAHIFLASRINNPQSYLSFAINPRYRINNHITFQYKLGVDQSINKKGSVDFDKENLTIDDDDIIFGNRDMLTFENSISTKYSFSTKSSLALAVRHYWSTVDYDTNFFKLNYNGTLSEHDYTNNHDLNYNIWNLDINYSWEFAPGSQLSVLYRNSIYDENSNINLSFSSNIKDMFNVPLYNNLSLKFIYYLDYNRLKT